MRQSLLIVAVGLVSAPAFGADIRVLPERFALDGPKSLQRINIVTLRDGLPSATVASDAVAVESSDSSVVRIEEGVAYAVGDGTAELVARTPDGATARSRVTVSNAGAPRDWSFRNDVQSVLARSGCNMGACHGALAGKGGFRLSLRGYDPFEDFHTITQQARGRRVEVGNPGMSLLLAKPTAALPHRGGLRLDTDSRDYKILAEWIASGAPGPNDDDARLERISVLPDSALLSSGQTMRVLVNAHYDDGRVVDVTHWSMFTATDEAVAQVAEDGEVSVVGSGEGAVLVWFGSQVALARLTVPFPNAIPDDVYARASRKNFIDELALQQLETLQLRPSPKCDDAAFLRRATIDTIGRLPTDVDREEYFAHPAAQRRDGLIERLLDSDDFADYWAYRLSDVLLINGNRLRPAAVKAYYQWVRESVDENKPWDEFVSEILTATGESNENGATNFYALHQTPEDLTENACQAFLGLSIGCAKCHNHPLEKWTNDQYYAMANLFARVRSKGWGGDSRSGNGLRTTMVAETGELIQPNKGVPQEPATLDGRVVAFDDPRDRREVLAEWLTDPANPYFSRAITNRVWANFFGRGLVEPVDDLRLSNPASNEPLLDAAAQHLVESRFDIKQLMRSILNSETYQRSSVAIEENREDPRYLSRYMPRRLMAEVLLDAIDQVLETSSTFDAIAFPGADRQKTDYYGEGTRAIELYDSAVESYFLKTFGRNPREITCECERDDEPSMVQALHLSNGQTLNPKLASDKNRIAKMIAAGDTDARIIDSLFLAALAREPGEHERELLLSVVGEYGPENRAQALQDVAWSILTSPEFVYNR